MVNKTIICASCGAEVEKTGRNQIYCKDCSDNAALVRKREHNAMLRDMRAANRHKPVNNRAEIVRITREGRERGLSYAQMVALGVH